MQTLTNWSKNHAYRAAAVHYPETLADVQAAVAAAPSVKALGTRHSFNDIADSGSDAGHLISTQRLDRVLALDPERMTVTVEAGIRYGVLGEYLNARGFALANLASLPHISVGGAVATATHGSGVGNASLAAAAVGLEMVTASGETVRLSRSETPDTFCGAVVALGALGVVTQLTLSTLPAFTVRQDVYENLPLDALFAHFDEIVGSGYSVSLFTDWRGPVIDQVWQKRRLGDASAREVDAGETAPTFFGATRAMHDRHPVPGVDAVNCTPQRGISGPWHERLPHFRLDFLPSSGDELQSEFFVPHRHAVAALRALDALREQLAPRVQVSEIRTIAADDLWLSPFYRENCVALHFTWRNEWDRVRELLPVLEKALAPFDARPHWGKLFTMPAASIRPLYPRFADFQELRRRFDPEGKFGNAFLDGLF